MPSRTVRDGVLEIVMDNGVRYVMPAEDAGNMLATHPLTKSLTREQAEAILSKKAKVMPDMIENPSCTY